MIDNTKEYIVCAAYRQSKNTSNRRKMINDIGKDPKSIYYALIMKYSTYALVIVILISYINMAMK